MSHQILYYSVLGRQIPNLQCFLTFLIRGTLTKLNRYLVAHQILLNRSKDQGIVKYCLKPWNQLMLLRTTGLFFIEPSKSWHEYFRWHTFHFFRYLKVKEVLLRIELFFLPW